MKKCKYCDSCELSKNGQTRGKQREIVAYHVGGACFGAAKALFVK